MPPTSSSSTAPDLDQLPAVRARVTYIAPGEDRAHVRIYPPNSGLVTVRPASVEHVVSIFDARSIADSLELDEQGFELRASPAQFTDFYDEAAVRARYYPEVRAAMLELTGAHEVIVFDHNVRSAARAARGEVGVRVPVAQVHNDYTEQSGPKRKREILEEAGRFDLTNRRVAFVIHEQEKHIRVTADVSGMRVRPSESLVSEVEKICGVGSVSLRSSTPTQDAPSKVEGR